MGFIRLGKGLEDHFLLVCGDTDTAVHDIKFNLFFARLGLRSRRDCNIHLPALGILDGIADEVG